MHHKVSKIKVKGGVDANRMLVKKLVRNFVEHGTLTTTLTRASYLKSMVERLAHDALDLDESTKNILMSYLGSGSKVQEFVVKVKSHVLNGTGSGIVRILKLGPRQGDAAPSAQVVWSKQVEKQKSVKTPKTAKQS